MLPIRLFHGDLASSLQQRMLPFGHGILLASCLNSSHTLLHQDLDPVANRDPSFAWKGGWLVGRLATAGGAVAQSPPKAGIAKGRGFRGLRECRVLAHTYGAAASAGVQALLARAAGIHDNRRPVQRLPRSHSIRHRAAPPLRNLPCGVAIEAMGKRCSPILAAALGWHVSGLFGNTPGVLRSRDRVRRISPRAWDRTAAASRERVWMRWAPDDGAEHDMTPSRGWITKFAS
ncbi:hypothetical protein RJ55_02804 [Drechmeria coniospora]|nr:hypothetical protein RJ55_02804 [Drechmeria coniospora]